MQQSINRALQLQDQHEYAASSKLLDPYIDNLPVQTTRKDSTQIIDLLRIQGDNFYYIGITTRAAELYEHALKIADAIDETRRAAELSNQLFKIHLNSDNTALSRDLVQRSIELYRSLNDAEGVCKMLNNLGICQYKMGDYAQSLQTYTEALNMASKDNNLRAKLLPTILTNLAETHYKQGEYNIANHYLDQAIELNGGRYDNPVVLQSWLNKAEVQAAIGNTEEAHDILRTVGKNIKFEDPYILSDAYNQISQLHLRLGDSLPSLRWGLKAQAMADSLHTKQENEQLRQILIRYNSERIADHNKILELNVKRQRMLNHIMIALIVIFVAFAVFLIYKLRVDRQKNLLIRTQKEQLMEFERMEHDRKEKEYREQLDHKNRQLTSYSIDAASISELHKILIDSLKRMRGGANPAFKSEINDDIALLQNFNHTEVNEDFRVYFNEVHPDLFKRLSEKFPALTPNDLRLCSYLYLGMSTKEIAALTFREIRSVESSRLRLRKKLGIHGEQSLHDFLHSI